MKNIIKILILFSTFSLAQSKNEKPEITDWKFLAFHGGEKIYYLPASLKSVGDIFRIKLLQISGEQEPAQYTVFIEDYNSTKLTNRVVQVNTYDKYWRPIDQITIDNNTEDELWVHLKKGTNPYKLYERLLAGVKKDIED